MRGLRGHWQGRGLLCLRLRFWPGLRRGCGGRFRVQQIRADAAEQKVHSARGRFGGRSHAPVFLLLLRGGDAGLVRGVSGFGFSNAGGGAAFAVSFFVSFSAA